MISQKGSEGSQAFCEYQINVDQKNAAIFLEKKVSDFENFGIQNRKELGGTETEPMNNNQLFHVNKNQK